MIKFAVFCALFYGSLASLSEREYKMAFLNWMREHKRSYDSDEFRSRYAVFRDNYDFVRNWDGEHEVALNAFADLSNTEFASMFLGLNLFVDPATLVRDNEVPVDLPTSVDWRTKNAVTPVKNQGQCGSCWSFSTTGSVEGCHALATGSLVSFSEQNLVDCSTSEGNDGCNGGLMDDAFQYIINNQGLDTESSYPYSATGPNKCQYKAANSGGKISGFKDVTSGSESALATAAVGAPVSVAIDASHSSFQFYSSGIYYEPACSSTQLDHGVLVVGFGSTSSVAAQPTWKSTTATDSTRPTTTSTNPNTNSTSGSSSSSSSTSTPTSSSSTDSSSSTTPTTTTSSGSDSDSDSSSTITPTTTSGSSSGNTTGVAIGSSSTSTNTPAPSPSPSNGLYWIVKNSWGTSWGLSGYIWMARNRDNNCGIATSASYPTGCSN